MCVCVAGFVHETAIDCPCRCQDVTQASIPQGLKQSFCIGFTGEVFSFRAALSFVQKRITKAYRTYIPAYLHPSVLTDVRTCKHTNTHTYSILLSGLGVRLGRSRLHIQYIVACIHVLALSFSLNALGPEVRRFGL